MPRIYTIVLIVAVILLIYLYAVSRYTPAQRATVRKLRNVKNHQRVAVERRARADLARGDFIAFIAQDEPLPAAFEQARVFYEAIAQQHQALPRVPIEARERVMNLDAHMGQWQEWPEAYIMSNPARTNVEAIGTLRDVVIPEEAATIIANVAPVRSDSQNVHDSAVVASIKTIVEHLRPQMADMTETEIQQELDAYARTHNTQKATQAARAFAAIRAQPQNILAYGHNNIDAVRMVWNAVPRETLVDALSSCYENGNMVCMMGRFNRIIDSTAGMQNMPAIKTRDILRREILETAAKIRTEYEESGNTTDANQKNDDEFRQILRTRLNSIYTTPAGPGQQPAMSQAALDAEIAEWIDHI